MRAVFLLLLWLSPIPGLLAQDTFSIVAVDSVTGEVGSAGASCLDDNDIAGGVSIICDVKPGRGAINTQSFWLASNQNNASGRMDLGDSPQQIIDWLTLNDATNDPTVRQYGIADFDSTGSPRSAAFTGTNCFDYKNHILGPNYAIQGNILLGQEILDSMETRFLNTQGSLAEKLMAALQGANVPGADTRCLSEGVSSQSAYIKVAKPDDTPNNFYLDIVVGITPFGKEPIDSVQVLFDAWQNPLSVQEIEDSETSFITFYPNPAGEVLNFRLKEATTMLDPYTLTLSTIEGREIISIMVTRKTGEVRNFQHTGVVLFQLEKDGEIIQSGKFIRTAR